jgi:hypothetical protein
MYSVMDYVIVSTLGLVLLFCLIVLYFIPALVAFDRRHCNKASILVLNLLLGWTFVFWVAALVWALTSPPRTAIVR